MTIQNVVFIDSRVAGYENLIAGFAADTQWYLLEAGQDGVTQIQRFLANHVALDSIQVVSHGSAGTLYLGSTLLDSDNLARYQTQLQSIGASLSKSGDILLYGCDVAQGEAGLGFVNALAQLTGADVVASDDRSGAPEQSADSVLEVATGVIETETYDLSSLTQSLALLVGGEGNDRLVGTAVNDTINGRGGDDTLLGGAGADSIDGGTGNDSIDGGTGSDIINGADGNDWIDGGLAHDVIDGGAGNDTIFGGEGNDDLRGGVGNDILDGGTGDDYLRASGGEGNDTLIGGSGNDSFAVSINNSAGTQTVRVYGGDGEDQIQASVVNGAGSVIASGGSGRDTYSFFSGEYAYGLTITDFAAGAGGDLLNLNTLFSYSAANGRGYPGGNPLDPTSGYFRLVQSGAHTELQYDEDGAAGTQYTWHTAITLQNVLASTVSTSNILGLSITGTAGADTLIGGYGVDIFNGAAGDDVLDGGQDADSLTGGLGNDTYYVDDLGDAVIENPNEGIDVVFSTVKAYSLLANVENGRILSTSAANLYGNALDNVIYAGAGNNVMAGGAGNDTLAYNYGVTGNNGVTVSLAITTAQATGGSGTDTLSGFENLYGSSNNDHLTGTSGDNVLNGGLGNDTLIGGAGNDTYVVNTGADVIIENANAGIDTVNVQSGSYIMAANIENGRISTAGAANITGNNLSNTLYAGAGNNVISGGTGAEIDTLSYADATSAVRVSLAITTAQATLGSGTDTLINIEHLIGSRFNDTLTGSASNDVLDGDTGNDSMDGGAGNDVLNGGLGNDIINGGADNDLLNGGEGNDTLNGGAGDDILNGGAGNDSLIGGASNDVFDGGAGKDTMAGGLGNDIYYVYEATDIIVEGNDASTDIVYSYVTNYSLADYVENGRIFLSTAANLYGNGFDNIIYAGIGNNVMAGGYGNDTLSYAYGTTGSNGVTVTLDSLTAQNTGGSGIDTLSSFENLSGSSNNDTLTGNNGNNVLNGAQGNDLLSGGSGSDTLIGGLGIDTLIGGLGNDTYYVEDLTDVIIENANEGSDVVFSRLQAYTLQTNIEDGRILSTTTANLYGNAHDNILYAGVGDNVLAGGEGNDTLAYAYGVTGSNGVTVNLALTTAQVTGGSGTDTLSGFENLSGSSHNDHLTGNSGDNVLNGGLGNDTLIGGAGDDTYVIDTSADVVIEDADAGIDTVEVRFSGYTLGANIENGRLSTTANADITGNDLSNTLYAGAGNNVISGGTGAEIDTVSYAGAGAVMVKLAITTAQETYGSGIDTLINIENIIGSSHNDQLTGTADNNLLDGAGGYDLLWGGDGDDTLIGGGGADTLNGGAGNDVFYFNAASDMDINNYYKDVITDFARGQDKIDLSAIDANIETVENDAFHSLIVGRLPSSSDSFSFTSAGELYYDYGTGILYGNINADTEADFSIRLVGLENLSTADLVL